MEELLEEGAKEGWMYGMGFLAERGQPSGALAEIRGDSARGQEEKWDLSESEDD